MPFGFNEVANLGIGGVSILAIIIITRRFLDHLEKKNGHLERIAKNFAETTKEVGNKVVESNVGVQEAIGKNTTAIKLLTQAHENKHS